MENFEVVVAASLQAVGVIIGVGALGVSIALGIIGSKAATAIGRNPEVKNDILQTSLILAFMLFIVLIILLLFATVLLYANPFVS